MDARLNGDENDDDDNHDRHSGDKDMFEDNNILGNVLLFISYGILKQLGQFLHD